MVCVRGFRWGALFHPARPARWPLATATLIGYMGNNVLPLRAGELVRGYLAARSGGISLWTAIATLAVERVLDALSILLILAGVVFLVEVPAWLQAGALTLLTLDLLAMGVLIFLAREWGLLGRILASIPRYGGALTRWGGRFSTGLGSLRPGPHLAPLFAWTTLIWILNAGAVWAALHSGGLALPLSASLTVLAFAGIGVSLPSAPGYVGTLQFFMVQALALYPVTRADAISVSFLFHAAVYVPVTVLGWGLLAAQGVSLSEAAREARARSGAVS